MMVFTESSTRRAPSPWGMAVKMKLIEQNLQQDEMVRMLRDKGFKITKGHFSNLLYGIGATNRQEEIRLISDYLQIPYDNSGQTEEIRAAE